MWISVEIVEGEGEKVEEGGRGGGKKKERGEKDSRPVSFRSSGHFAKNRISELELHFEKLTRFTACDL